MTKKRLAGCLVVLLDSGGPAYDLTCAFTGAWLYLLCRAIGVDGDVALMAGIAATAAFRLAALRWNIHLPSTAERIKASEPKIDETRKNG